MNARGNQGTMIAPSASRPTSQMLIIKKDPGSLSHTLQSCIFNLNTLYK